MQGTTGIGKFDWTTILLYFALVVIGWFNIYSASLPETATVFFDFQNIHSKQLVWIGLSVVLILFILGVDSKFYERFSSVIYILAIVSLVGLFVFGSTIAGQRAWYAFGGMSLQPAEFVKAATALAMAKYLSDMQTNIKEFKDQLKAFLILLIPIVLILMQPDPGSALIYFAFIFPMYREGMHGAYLLLGFFAAFLFVLTLAFDPPLVIAAVILIVFTLFLKNRKRRPSVLKYVLISLACIGFSLSVDFVFDKVFKQHHRDRFNIVLGKEIDIKGVGYNTNQSEIAIGSGGWFGKGWTQGTQTKGNFVPEQHTDYIFSTVGEEWGFAGSFLVVLLFVFLIIRLLYLAEKQHSTFNRVYGYSVAAILFVHFFVNISMVIGLFPTVGIPLPFLSYGGSALWGFTVLIFIFLRLDSQKHIHG
ncbi:rod shape-determining protein RodA [Planktosalinus lacus]|uniref:Cell wall polymerase n=1 Tax=Planktosalinus lacus TaxID=1526573 RepID=A0A8J2V824_9FLAO|nr:rod shape-determining protein RodA [Planktosalinus lacus]GGD85991.1 rod shape-determining protein RodA [Planktosalinus lacus]